MKKAIIPILTLFISAYLQSNEKDIRYLTNIHGLSNSSITCILQDSLDLLWFGTWDGLNMYNSCDFKVFKPDLSAASISNNIIRDIVEERKGILWIATDYGINRYDAVKDEFKAFFCSNTKKSVFQEYSFHVCKDSNNRIFSLVNEYGFFYYDSSVSDFVSLDIDFKYNLKFMFFDNNNNLWFLSEHNELYQVLIEFPLSVNKPIVKGIKKYEHNVKIYSAFFDRVHNKIWAQTERHNLICIDVNSRKEEYVLTSFDSTVSSILFCDKYCLIGTLDGLYKYSYDNKVLSVELNDIQILSILEGSQDIIWIGTGARGVIMYANTSDKFRAYTLNNYGYQEIAPVRAFAEDYESNLYIGTKWKGLYIQTKKTGSQKTLTTDDGLLHNTINALGVTHNKKIIWLCTEGRGLNYYNSEQKKLYELKSNRDFDLSGTFSIYAQNDTTLWIGTNGYGFYKVIIDDSLPQFSLKSFKQYSYSVENINGLNNNVVYSIVPDGKEALWIGTRGGGLNHFDIKTETFGNFRFDSNDSRSISNDDIICLYNDNNNHLWAGTSFGLNKLISTSGQKAVFQRYMETDGLPNNTIHGILEDNNGFLWVSTNKGLAKLDEETKKTISYLQTDGLQDNEFSDGGYYRSLMNDDFYFGGISGYTVFNPHEIVPHNYYPRLYLDEFSINNHIVKLNWYNYYNTPTNILKMGYNDKFFSFHFTPVDYVSSEKCELVYMLENYDKGWINIGPSRTIVYSNLPSGDYILKAKCRNANKEWSHEYVIPIKIDPPWWLSQYAYIIYTIVILSSIYLIYGNSRNKVIMRHQLELKTLESQKTEEIHQAKLRFFTNIAHEFSNSLTLIYGPSEQLLKNNNNDTQTNKYLNVIQSNAERMQGLIQQLMEFRKVENDYLDLNIIQSDIAELISYICDNFTDIAENKNIELNININPNVDIWNTDRGAFEKIVFNLLSNAFKYTPENGYVNLEATIKNEKLQIIVTNSGQGIKDEDKSLVFNRFKILDSFESQILEGVEIRTGIGLALCKTLVELLKGTINIDSEIGKFASFIVELPYLEESDREKEHILQELSIEKNNDKEDNLNKESLINRQTENKGNNKEDQTILIIDDDKAIRELLSDILGKNYKIVTSGSGRDALNIIKTNTPHLIICDIIMPNMNGIEFLEQLKKDEINSHIPVILLSSNTSIESRIRGIDTGADTYITKPFHSEYLEVTIKQLLNNKESLKKYFDSPISNIENIDGKMVHKEAKEFIIKLTHIITENLSDENFSLEILSKKMGVSKIQLYRKLKEIKGESPTEYIRKIRLTQAEKLLKTTNKTVQEIMYLCGFNNKAHFYRIFLKEYNQTPKEYRKFSRKK